MLFEPLTYRNSFPKERFQPFTVSYKEQDVWIGVNPDALNDELKSTALEVLSGAVDKLDQYLEEQPFFKKSLKACPVEEDAPEIAQKLGKAGEIAAVGPTAGRSGYFVAQVGEALLEQFDIQELIVETGGDLFLKLQSNLIVNIFADDPDDSGLMGLEILAEQTPLAIGTGAGTKGQPINHGQANAVMVAAKSGAEAGALAVGIGNRVKKVNDLDKVLKHLKLMPEVLAAVFIIEDQIAVHGDNELKLIL